VPHPSLLPIFQAVDPISISPQPPHDAAMLHYYLTLASYYSPLYLASLHHLPHPPLLQPHSTAPPTPPSRTTTTMPHIGDPSPSPPPPAPPSYQQQPSTATGLVFRDETDRLATQAERRRATGRAGGDTTTTLPRRKKRTERGGTREEEKREEGEEEEEEEEEEDTDANRGTWRDKQGSFTFHSLESLEASKKKGGRVRLKWRKES
jgi:hypothetical protein